MRRDDLARLGRQRGEHLEEPFAGPHELGLGGRDAAEQAVSEEVALEAVIDIAAEVYHQADDEWASAEYRAAVVSVLVGRLLSRGGD